MKGSSETIRKATYCFRELERYKYQHKKTISHAFLEWFCGFAEGDGSIIVSNNRPFFFINQKDPKVLYSIKKELGFGSIKKYNGFYRYTVSSRRGILCLLAIFNGNFLLEKTNKRLTSWCTLFKIEKKPKINLHHSQLLHHYWLSGFTDAEGCFSAYLSKDKRYCLGQRLRLVFTLDQDSEKNVLELIKNGIGSGMVSLRKGKNVESKEMYRYSLWGKKGQKEVIKYLQQYPLRSQKKIEFLRWRRIYDQSCKKLDINSRKNLFQMVSKS